MLLRRPETPSIYPCPLSPKRWLSKDSGAVGLGIVVALENSIISDSLAKTILTAAPVAIPSARPARRRIHESGRRQHKNSVDQRDGDFFRRSPATSCDKVIMPEFLSHCLMCRKRLHGKDIYMYTEKAFCSMECRYQQIVSDEVQEKCGKMSKISCSPCSGNGRLFFTGVAVA